MDMLDYWKVQEILKQARAILESDEFKLKIETMKATHKKKKEQRKAALGR